MREEHLHGPLPALQHKEGMGRHMMIPTASPIHGVTITLTPWMPTYLHTCIVSQSCPMPQPSQPRLSAHLKVTDTVGELGMGCVVECLLGGR